MQSCTTRTVGGDGEDPNSGKGEPISPRLDRMGEAPNEVVMPAPFDERSEFSIAPYAALDEADQENYKYNAHLWDLLDNVTSEVGFKRPGHTQCKILNLACGAGHESYLLSAFFGDGTINSPFCAARVRAVDISEGNMALAVERQNQLLADSDDVKRLAGAVNFESLDATDLRAVMGEDGPYDIVVLRHPQVTADFVNVGQKGVWRTIVANAVAATKGSGYVIATTLSGFEAQFLVSFLQDANAEILVDRAVSHVAEGLKGNKDSWVVVAKPPRG